MQYGKTENASIDPQHTNICINIVHNPKLTNGKSFYFMKKPNASKRTHSAQHF